MKAKELQIGDLVQICNSKYDATLGNIYHPITGWSLKIGDVIPVVEILSNGINPEWDGQENYGHILEEQLAPIPLTAEMFEKNGWEKRQIGNATVYFIPKTVFYLTKSYNEGFSIGVLLNDKMLNLLRIQFVHELQHALRLGKYSPHDLVSLADNFKAE